MFLTFASERLPAGTWLKADDLLDLSIILVNWNTRDLLKECIKSIIDNHEQLAIEIFVIDNASHDGSARMVKEYFPEVILIENEQNQGFAKANNQGIIQSKGRHILLLNPDTIVLPEALKQMVDFLDTRCEAGAVAAKLFNADKTLQYSIRRFPNILTPFTENPIMLKAPFMLKSAELSRLKNWDHNSIAEVDQPAGAAFMIKRSVIETLGSLDHNYHMFFEDVDICYRIKRNGWRTYYLPDAEIIHYGGRSVMQRYNIGEEFYRSMLMYFRKHHGNYGELKVRLSMIFGSCLYFTYALLKFFVLPREAYSLIKSSISIFRYGFKFRSCSKPALSI